MRWERSFDYVNQTPCSVGYYIFSSFPQFKNGSKSRMVEQCGKWLIELSRDFEKEAMGLSYEEKLLLCND